MPTGTCGHEAILPCEAAGKVLRETVGRAVRRSRICHILYINGNLIPQKYIDTFNYRPEGQGAEGMFIPTKEYEQELGGHHFHIIEFDTPEAQMNFGPYKVPNDCYFVMGDNRDNVMIVGFGVAFRNKIF